jgi:hypothetical protein
MIFVYLVWINNIEIHLEAELEEELEEELCPLPLPIQEIILLLQEIMILQLLLEEAIGFLD